MDEQLQTHMQEFQQVYNAISEFLVNYSFQIVGAIIIFILGWFLSRRAGVAVENLLVKYNIDVTLSRFTGNGSRIAILVIVAIMALGKLGISVTPFIAAVGAISLGAGLALQGMLANYAAGVTIIVTRPFVVGDTIAVQGVTGLVHEVRLGSTMLTNEDNVQIMIPNKHILGEIIHNSYASSIVEMTISIAYDSDTTKASALLVEAISGTAHVSHEKAPQVGIHDFGDDGYLMGVRYWARTEVLFQTRYAVNARIRDTLNANQIAFTYPQREVRLLQ